MKKKLFLPLFFRKIAPTDGVSLAFPAVFDIIRERFNFTSKQRSEHGHPNP